MVQHEVGERLAAPPGSAAYGIPSLLRRAVRRRQRWSGSVGPAVFHPRPRVRSALVSITPTRATAGRRRGRGADVAARAHLVRAAPQNHAPIAQRPGDAGDDLEAAGIDAAERPERLPLEAFGRLADAISTRRAGSDDGVIELVAPAKLTLTPRVVGVRDDGMHLIDAEMVTARPRTTGLEVDDTAAATRVQAVGPACSGGRRWATTIWWRGRLRLVGRTASVTVHKAIPAGAGLGGGSADAAAILRWAGHGDSSGGRGAGRRCAVLPGRRPRSRGRDRRGDRAAAAPNGDADAADAPVGVLDAGRLPAMGRAGRSPGRLGERPHAGSARPRARTGALAGPPRRRRPVDGAARRAAGRRGSSRVSIPVPDAWWRAPFPSGWTGQER